MTPKEQVWLSEYVNTRFNATEAARRAGYKWPEKQGYQLKKRLKKTIKTILNENALSPEEAIYLLSQQATSSHADFTDVNLRQDLKDHPKAHLIKTIITDVYEDKAGKIHHKMRLELYDAQAAIRDILRIHGKFADPGSSAENPFIIRVMYDQRTNGSPETPVKNSD